MRWNDVIRAMKGREEPAALSGSPDSSELAAALNLLQFLAPVNKATSFPSFATDRPAEKRKAPAKKKAR